jgi:hypothetical protein
MAPPLHCHTRLDPVLQRGCDLNENILLITGNDDTYRQPLLEAQGYSVRRTTIEQAFLALGIGSVQLVLVTSENGIDTTLAFCEQLKAAYPSMRVGILAQRADYIPSRSCADIVVRAQYSPAKFLAAVKRILESPSRDGRGVLVEDEGGS